LLTPFPRKRIAYSVDTTTSGTTKNRDTRPICGFKISPATQLVVFYWQIAHLEARWCLVFVALNLYRARLPSTSSSLEIDLSNCAKGRRQPPAKLHSRCLVTFTFLLSPKTRSRQTCLMKLDALRSGPREPDPACRRKRAAVYGVRRKAQQISVRQPAAAVRHCAKYFFASRACVNRTGTPGERFWLEVCEANLGGA